MQNLIDSYEDAVWGIAKSFGLCTPLNCQISIKTGVRWWTFGDDTEIAWEEFFEDCDSWETAEATLFNTIYRVSLCGHFVMVNCYHPQNDRDSLSVCPGIVYIFTKHLQQPKRPACFDDDLSEEIEYSNPWLSYNA